MTAPTVSADRAIRRPVPAFSAAARRRAAPAGAPGAGAGRSGLAAGVDLVVLGVALALALTPLLPVYGGATAVPALVGGLLVGGAVGVVGARRRWSALAVVAALVVGLLLVGAPLAAPATAVAHVLPGPAAPAAVARGAASAWKEVLTLMPPIGSGGTVLMAALLLALVGAAGATSIALRVRRAPVAAFAAVVPVAVAAAAALLGTGHPPVPPVIEGTALAVLLAGWASWRAGRLAVRRALATGVVAAVAVGAGLAGAPGVTAGHPRFVLRDHLTPPFDPDDYPSPLAAFRQYVKLDDTVLLTVTGLPEGARIRLASFDRYDGVVWNVAGDGTAPASGQFRRVGGDLPAPVDGDAATVRVEVGALNGPWLPTVGEPTRITVEDADAAAGLRFNDATGAAVLTGGLHTGLVYTLDVLVPTSPSVTDLGAAPASDVAQSAPVGVPARIASLAPDIAREAGNPAEVVEALAQWLVDRGYLSHGQAGEHPSLSGHGADRLATFLGGDVMVGDGEQYAATLALMVREMGLPARVVLGFVAGSGSSGAQDGETVAPVAPAADGAPTIVTGADVQAWVEVPFPGHGWVAFDATPPEGKTVDENPDPAPSDPKPQVVQPPPPVEGAVDAPDDDAAQPSTRQDDGPPAAAGVWRTVLAATAAGLGGLLLLVGPLVAVAALKLARRRRRRRGPDPVRRLAAGWDELMDAATDLRRSPPGHPTRREAADAVGECFVAREGDEGAAVVAVRLVGLALRADRAVFARGAPGEEEVAAYWEDVDETVRAMRTAVPARLRWRARASTRSLRGRVAAPGRPGGKVPVMRSTLLLRRRGGAL